MTLDTIDVSTSADWRSWLGENHSKVDGIWLVFHNKSSGELSISFEDALDEALAYGWIDSVIRKIDDCRYARKFTPRNAKKSSWSESNIQRVKQLKKEGRMTKWGLDAFEKRDAKSSSPQRKK